MGVGLGIMFDTDVPGSGTFEEFIADGKELTYELPRLDEICHRIGVPAFSRFCPYDPSDETLYEGLSEGETLEEIWFDPADGIRTINPLTESLISEREQTNAKRNKREIDALIGALEALKTDLTLAKKEKARFALIFY